MRKFWCFYDNGTYRVGSNGPTIYIYDQEDKELAKFKDVSYAHKGAFMPGKNIFVAKTTDGVLAVYNLDEMKLIKKRVITRLGAQDEGFAFTPDGAYFYNIEKPRSSTRTQLTLYKTSDFSVYKTYFENEEKMVLEYLEFEDETNKGYVLGFMRGEDGVFDYGFIGIFEEGEVRNIKKLEYKDYDYISAYKDWEITGFTEKKLEWCRIKDYANKPSISLKEAYSIKE